MTDKSELLTDLVYLNEGLVTPKQWNPQGLDGNHIKVALDQMTPEESRKARRKFRKLHRRACKRRRQELERYLTRKTWEKWGVTPILTKEHRLEYVTNEQVKLDETYGKKGLTPTIGQARNRRRAVFESLREADTFTTILNEMDPK